MHGLQSSLKFAQVRQRSFKTAFQSIASSARSPPPPYQHARMTCNTFKFCRTNLRIEHKSLSRWIWTNCQLYIGNKEEKKSSMYAAPDQHAVNYCKDSLNSITATDNVLRQLYLFIQSCICYNCVIMYNWLDIAIIL